MRNLYPMVIAGMVFFMPMANAQNNPQEFTLKVTQTDLETLGKALGKMPYDEVAQLITSLRNQVIEQTKPKQSEPEKK